MGYRFFSDYTVSRRADARSAVLQLREATQAGAGLMSLYRGMLIAEAKLLDLGAGFEAAAGRMADYAPPTAGELDEMLRALEEPAKASCEACEAFGCSACDQAGVTFAEPEAA